MSSDAASLGLRRPGPISREGRSRLFIAGAFWRCRPCLSHSTLLDSCPAFLCSWRHGHQLSCSPGCSCWLRLQPERQVHEQRWLWPRRFWRQLRLQVASGRFQVRGESRKGPCHRNPLDAYSAPLGAADGSVVWVVRSQAQSRSDTRCSTPAAPACPPETGAPISMRVQGSFRCHRPFAKMSHACCPNWRTLLTCSEVVTKTIPLS